MKKNTRNFWFAKNVKYFSKMNDGLVNCSELLQYFNIETKMAPIMLFCHPCKICGCLANHNFYLDAHQSGVDSCESCEKKHPGKLCNPLDLRCKRCGENLVDVTIGIGTNKMRTAKKREHKCEKVCCHHVNKHFGCKHCSEAKDTCNSKNHCMCLKESHTFLSEHQCGKCKLFGHHSRHCF